MGQNENNSVRAYVFRFAFELGHCSMQSACLKRARSRHALQLLQIIRDETLGQAFRIRQRDEMATSNFRYFLSEPFTRHAPLKFDREKTVVSSRKNMNGDVRPALEAAVLAENGLGFLAWVFGAGAQYIRRYVV